VQLDEPLAAGKQRLAAYLVNSGSKNGGASYSPSFTVIETPDAAIVHVPANNSQTTPYPTFSGSGLAGATVSVAMLANGLPSDVIA